MRLVVEVIGHVVVRAAADEANEDVDALREESPGAQEEDEHQDVEGSRFSGTMKGLMKTGVHLAGLAAGCFL